MSSDIVLINYRGIRSSSLVFAHEIFIDMQSNEFFFEKLFLFLFLLKKIIRSLSSLLILIPGLVGVRSAGYHRGVR